MVFAVCFGGPAHMGKPATQADNVSSRRQVNQKARECPAEEILVFRSGIHHARTGDFCIPAFSPVFRLAVFILGHQRRYFVDCQSRHYISGSAPLVHKAGVFRPNQMAQSRTHRIQRLVHHQIGLRCLHCRQSSSELSDVFLFCGNAYPDICLGLHQT